MIEMRETYCDYCDDFRPVQDRDRIVTCNKCDGVILRRNGSGLSFCDNCRDYRPADESPACTTDGGEYRYFDVVCRHCAWIMFVTREPLKLAVAAAPESR